MKHNTKIRFKLDIQFFADTLDRTKIVSKIQTDSSDTFDIVPNKIANTSGNYYAELPTLTQNETIATGTQLATKQDTLVSGTNIKTINEQSILGSGNITIESGTDLKARYNLGAFDTVDTSNTDYDLVTRQTGYVVLGKLNYSVASSGKFYSGGILDTIVKNTDYKRIKFARLTIQNVGSLDYLDDMSMSIDASGYIQIRNDSCNSDANSLKAFLGNDIAEYQLQTSYIEKVIKDQPLNTLDQQGSEFVREEWEKGLNVFEAVNTRSADGVTCSLSDQTITITGTPSTNSAVLVYFDDSKIKAGNYSIVLNGTYPSTVIMWDNDSPIFLNNSNSFTLSNTIRDYIQINTVSGTTYNYSFNIMLVEGDHAYPYQPYNGAIVHEKELSNYVTLNGDNKGSGSLSYESNEIRDDVTYKVGSYLAQDGYFGAYERNLSTNNQYGLNINATGLTYNDTEGGGHLCSLSFGNSGTIAVTSDIPTNNNQLTNGAGYITSSGSCNYATSAGAVAWSNITSKPSLVNSVNGSSGDITLTKSSVGLGNVDNTSDLDKPISTATQAALDELEAEMEEASVTITDSSMSKVSGISDGLALPPASQMEMLSIKGNTIAWNQILEAMNGTYWSAYNSNYASASFSNGVGTITVIATGASDYNYGIRSTFSSYGNHSISGHKYLILFDVYSNRIGIIGLDDFGGYSSFSITPNQWNRVARIWEETSSYGHDDILINPKETVQIGDTLQWRNVKIIDLTLAYPTDTPTTPTDPRVQWCIDFALEHPEFASKLVNVGLTAYETKGINQWDEEWINGYYNSSTGAYVSNAKYVCSKNKCKVIGGSSLFVRLPRADNTCDVTLLFYDAGNNYLGYVAAYGVNSSTWIRSVPNNACWFHLYITDKYGATYNHDICINVSNSAINGQYFPYVKHTYPLLWNGKSAGSVYDEKLANGKEITRVGSYTFTGNEVWTSYSSAGQYDTYSSDSLSMPAPSLADLNGEVICSNGYAKVSGVYSGTALGIGFDYNRCYISVPSGANPNDIFSAGTTVNYQLLTPTETDGDPLPNAIAVYQGGTEWQINDGAPATITKNYDISIKDQVLTNVKVDARQEEEIEELKAKPCMDITEPETDFVRKEWEKGLNLLPNSSNVVLSGNVYFNCPPLRAGIHYLSFTTPIPNSLIVVIANSSNAEYGTYTISGYGGSFVANEGDKLARIYSGDSFTSNIMLVEGSHPYPYQPYNGEIVREKDIEPVLLWENGNPDSSFAAQTISVPNLNVWKYFVIAYRTAVTVPAITPVKFKYVAYDGENSIYWSLPFHNGEDICSRLVNLTGDTQIRFDDCHTQDNTVYNSYMIPIAIYGTNVL